VLGRSVARQCQIIRGLVPMLAAPSPDGERVLRDTIRAAAEQGLLGAGDHAVCVEKISGDYCIKMVSVDDSGMELQTQALKVHGAGGRPQMVSTM
jgi:pyruvate kinase